MNKIIIFIIMILVAVIFYYSNFLIEKIENEEKKYLTNRVEMEKETKLKPVDEKKEHLHQRSSLNEEKYRKEFIKSKTLAEKVDDKELIAGTQKEEKIVENQVSEEEAFKTESSKKSRFYKKNENEEEPKTDMLAEERYGDVLKDQETFISKREKEKEEERKKGVPILETIKEKMFREEMLIESPHQPLVSQPSKRE